MESYNPEKKVPTTLSPSNEFSISEFISEPKVWDICNDNYILFIGSESILEGNDINKCIRDNVNVQSFNEIFNKDNKKDEKRKKAIYYFCKDKLCEIDKNLKFSEGLERLLKTRLFKIIITTTISNSIKELLEKIWQDYFDVKEYSPQSMSKQNGNFWKELLETQKPTLVYLFGRADNYADPEQRFVCYDDAAFPFIRSLMTEMFYNESPMKKFFSHNKILSLGCNFDDWYSRFFWYILTDGLQSDNNKEKAAAVFYLSSDDKTPQKKLSKFFERNTSINNYSVNIGDFSKQLEEFFNAGKSEITRWIAPPKKDDNRIILSYVGRKRSDVRKIYFKLKVNNYDVCLNDEVIPGPTATYSSAIADAYYGKKLYIIILTPEIKELLEDENTKNDIKKKLQCEYNLIMHHNVGKPVLLLAVNGYSFASDYHKEIIEIYGKRSGINLMVDGGWEQFTSFLTWVKGSTNHTQHNVFISYNNKNIVDAYHCFDELKEFDPWLDYYYLAGEKNWDTSIENAIKNSKLFISLLTPEVKEHFEAKEEHYYLQEIEWAMKHKIPIIPYALNGYDFETDYHTYLARIITDDNNKNRVNGFKGDGFNDLKKQIRTKLSKI